MYIKHMMKSMLFLLSQKMNLEKVLNSLCMLMDALIFSTPSSSFKSIFVAGQKISLNSDPWKAKFAQTMAQL
jgi:hypothetical protein